MRPVWSTIGIERYLVQVVFHYFEIIFRNKAIRVENHQKISLGPLKAKVAREALTGVGFEVISDIKLLTEFLYDMLTFIGRAVLNDQYFKVGIGLFSERFQ